MSEMPARKGETMTGGGAAAAPLAASGGAEVHVRLAGVSHRFASGTPLVLEDVGFDVPRGEVVVLLGPSGCGKTTLLRMMAGLLAPTQGELRVDGAPPRPGRGSATVFQSFRLLPWKTAEANIAFALPHLPKDERLARARRYLDLVGLTRFAQAHPAALSGGMKQRLALARALACEPDLLLMDEPFASLDAQARELMQMELLRLMAARPATVVFVTHSVDEALLLGDRIVLLKPRPGRLAKVLPVPFPKPRWRDDPRGLPEFQRMRDYLWSRIREMVLSDPASDFYGRDLGGPLPGEGPAG